MLGAIFWCAVPLICKSRTGLQSKGMHINHGSREKALPISSIMNRGDVEHKSSEHLSSVFEMLMSD